jgi:hypothetical protein
MAKAIKHALLEDSLDCNNLNIARYPLRKKGHSRLVNEIYGQSVLQRRLIDCP